MPLTPLALSRFLASCARYSGSLLRIVTSSSECYKYFFFFWLPIVRQSDLFHHYENVRCSQTVCRWHSRGGLSAAQGCDALPVIDSSYVQISTLHFIHSISGFVLLFRSHATFVPSSMLQMRFLLNVPFLPIMLMNVMLLIAARQCRQYKAEECLFVLNPYSLGQTLFYKQDTL